MSLIEDGNGLNPLLQNYWMVIHPPILFLDPMFSSGVTLVSVSAQKAAHLVIKKLNNEDVDWEKE